MTTKIQFINHFTLKIIALILMTIDHIAYFFISPTNYNEIYMILRIIGRLAFPIFCFLSSQGSLKSRNPLIYFLKLLIVGLIMDLVEFFITKTYQGNSLIALALGVLSIYLLNKMNYYSFLSIIPLSIMVLSSFSFFPIRMDNGLLAALLFILFFISEKTPYFYFKIKKLAINDEIETEYQTTKNILFLVSTVIGYLILFLIDFYNLNPYQLEGNLSFKIQSYGMLAGLLFLFYNNKKGYSNKIVNNSLYLYYPLHILIFYLISLCIH